ncbi:MAG: hypothetical protein V2A65_07910 [Candidatus Omnitrophota bacterium]
MVEKLWAPEQMACISVKIWGIITSEFKIEYLWGYLREFWWIFGAVKI